MDDMVLALLPHSNTQMGPVWVSSMHSNFLPQSKDLHIASSPYYKLLIHVNVCKNGSMSLC